MGDLRERLDDLYAHLKLHPNDFKCPHEQACREGVPKFSKARMPSVGVRYLDEPTPRIAVLSLDSGSGSDEMKDRVVRIHRKDGLGPGGKH